MKRRSTPPTARRRTKPTLVRTHLAIVTGIDNAARGPSVHHEIELVKAGLLYADTIEVLSLSSRMVRDVVSFSNNEPGALLNLIASLDDQTLARMGGGKVAENRELLRALFMINPEAVRALASTSPESAAGMADLAGLLEEVGNQAASAMGDIQRIGQEMRVESGVAELESALSGTLVRLNENVVVSDDSGQVISSFLSELKRYLRDPNMFVLLDEQMASMTRSLISEGHVRPPERSVSNAAEAILGTGLLSRLPAFPSVPLKEAMELRQDLDDPLDRYRRKVAHLRGQLQTTPFSEHVQAEVDAVWRTEVGPTINDIRTAMADHSLVREVVRSLGRNVGDIAKGWAPAALTVFTGTQFQLEGALTAGLAAGAAVAPGLVQGAMDSYRGKSATQRHDLYYLYELDRRTQHREADGHR